MAILHELFYGNGDYDWVDVKSLRKNTLYAPFLYTTLTPGKWNASWENRVFAYANTKAQISFGGNLEADQCLWFRFTDSKISRLPKSELSSLKPSSVVIQLVCVGPGQKPRRPVFLWRGSLMSYHVEHRMRRPHQPRKNPIPRRKFRTEQSLDQ